MPNEGMTKSPADCSEGLPEKRLLPPELHNTSVAVRWFNMIQPRADILLQTDPAKRRKLSNLDDSGRESLAPNLVGFYCLIRGVVNNPVPSVERFTVTECQTV